MANDHSKSLLKYESHGDPSAPPVVFLHGFMGSACDWGEVIEHLSGTYYCIAVDLLGHGKSLDLADDDAYTPPGAATCVVRTMKHLHLIPAAVVGYSMGGRLALYLASHWGLVCSKLIVESATAGIQGEADRVTRQQADEKRARDLERGRFEEFLQTWYRQPLFATLAEDPDKLERIIQQRRLNNPTELARILRGMGAGAQAPLWSHLPGLTIPVLLMAGERDSNYVNIAGAMAKLLPHAVLEIVSGAGHNVHVENCRAVAERIKRFLRKE
ncbi:MAG: 2-succinyl-6-hydroxy-2,4-cyclohexadiene-1-carboxylate synthase [Desulfobacterales bacterium]|nr:2-succinyl-6-hydroxy-2,4-cyclohexadiene-1-carboxylate synthase [Desulfobacterales bacterium]